MTDDQNNPLQSPDCMQEKTELITGACGSCGQELEFFSVTELRNAKSCPKCKVALDTKSIAEKAGISI